MSDIVKIFGLPRSCTNVTEVLIKSNFKCRVYNNFPCWKHGVNTIENNTIHGVDGQGREVDTDDVKYVICTKNPLDWLWSLYSFEKNVKRYKDKSTREFLINPTYHYGEKRGNNGVWKESINKPVEVYNFLNHHWLTMSLDNTIHVKHESITTPKDQVKILAFMEDKFGLTRKSEKLAGKANRVNPSRKVLDKDYKKPMPAFNRGDIELINSQLDKRTLELLGYDFIPSPK